jgi:hypothetical protein
MKDITDQERNQLNTTLNDRLGDFSYCYYKTLFDPVQDIALYGIRNDKGVIQEKKKHLKSLGATYFRVVKTRYGSAIICFKANKMLNLIK